MSNNNNNRSVQTRLKDLTTTCERAVGALQQLCDPKDREKLCPVSVYEESQERNKRND